MLTRLEVHGFKNLINFSIDFGPFTCIAGLNGVGKSNIFDAIRFLSLLSDLTIIEAALAVRDSESSNPEDIFWTNGKTRAEKISLAAEMLVDQDVIDDFGRKATASSTFLRYEVEIKREASPNSMNGTTHLQLENESLNYFTKGEAKSQILFPHKASTFRDSVVKNKRRSGNFISTTRAKEDGVVEINLHQDSNSRGQPQKFPANYSPKTAIANTNSSVWPTILAARREMQAWRFLALEPSSMRRSNKFHETSSISSSGNHLASTLKKLSEQDSLALSSISNKLSSIIPISGLRVDTDEVRQLLTLEAKERAGAFLPARALSDGTLRFLTLCIMSEDPEFKGLLCFEEPENGIHPAKIESILTLLKEMSVNPQEPVSLDNPLRQIIIATHSPVLVQLQEVDDLVYIETVKVKGPDGSPTATLRCKSLEGSWRIYKDNQRTSKASIVAYLSYPRNAQITMEV